MHQTKRNIILSIFFIVATLFVNNTQAQQNASGDAQQKLELGLSNAAEISFVNSNNIINLEFNTTEDYANGVESGEQTLKVRSNKDFDIRVKANTARFSYSGSVSPAPKMSVNSVLSMKITVNNTGGSVTSGFSNYKNLSSGNQRIIKDGEAGGNQTFNIKYKANPGFSFPAGTYTVDIVYTVTQK